MVSSASPLAGSVDTHRIGLIGISTGGGTTLAEVSGLAAHGIPGDPRVKAFVVYEPSLAAASATIADAANIAVPYLLWRGDQMTTPSVVETVTQLIAATPHARPRLDLVSPGAIHLSPVTGFCDTLDETRTQSLEVDPREPLTTPGLANAAGAFTYLQWNFGDLQSVGFGGGRNMCDQLGLPETDANGDGLPDAYCAGGACDAKIPKPAPPARVMVPLVIHYTVAFLKVYVATDSRYLRPLLFEAPEGPGTLTIHH
jgi:hypothetical protein